jgi:hypothetical protein
MPGQQQQQQRMQPGRSQQQQQQQQQQQPYQLTSAQLSPAAHYPQQQQQQQQPDAHPTEPNTMLPIDQRVTNTLQQLFQSSEIKDGRNIGFVPTAKMAAQHEEHLQDFANQGHRPLYQFQVTKLRSWRTGYVRILALYKDYFCTLDPVSDTLTETNRWEYSSLTEWLALPKEPETILLQVATDKLKFSCHNVDRTQLLTALLYCQDQAGAAVDSVEFASCERQTRHGTRTGVTLQLKAYGLVEVHPVTKAVLQTYRYTDIRAVSFVAQNEAAVVLHFHQPGKSRLYWIHSGRQRGSGRSDLVTLMRENYEMLGLDLVIEESMAVEEWLGRRRNFKIGAIATSWQVSKTTRRHDSRLVGSEVGWVGGIVTRQLALTGDGYLVERDAGGMVSCRRLADLHAIVRHVEQSDQITLEYTNGSHRTYTSSSRDAFLVSILDAASTLGKNSAVHVSDVTSSGYCLTSLSSATSDGESAVKEKVPSSVKDKVSSAAALFHPISIPMYCLKRVHALSTQAYAFVSGQFEHFQAGEDIDIVHECVGIVEACREFNASVLPTGEGLPVGATDKYISGSIGALWGLVSNLLEPPSAGKNLPPTRTARDRQLAEHTACTFFQTLYRLSRTATGYKGSVELSTLQESLLLLWNIDDVFCKFWGFHVLNVLLSGLPKRDLESEYVNKRVILTTGGAPLINGLVSALLEPSSSITTGGGGDVSDLILMVASDILQSLLCSYHDTTTPDQFGLLINALAGQ